MKFFSVELSRYNNNDIEKMLISCANGNEIQNAFYYFDKIGEGVILPDAPVFDYFFLKSFEEKKYWEQHLFDVYDFSGQGSQIYGWFVSEEMKQLLESFILAKPYHFYPSKLLYKKRKLDYYIFQFDGSLILRELDKRYINWGKSVFIDPVDDKYLSINSIDGFICEYRRIYKIDDSGIKLEKLVLNEYLDFITMRRFTVLKYLVSERLKQAIEAKGMGGLQFSEIDYEVVIDEK